METFTVKIYDTERHKEVINKRSYGDNRSKATLIAIRFCRLFNVSTSVTSDSKNGFFHSGYFELYHSDSYFEKKLHLPDFMKFKV